jgi:hypothetical protein
VTILTTLCYRDRCTKPVCRNLSRMIFGHADAGGRPIDNGEFCLAYDWSKMERDLALDIKVYDDRELTTH